MKGWVALFCSFMFSSGCWILEFHLVEKSIVFLGFGCSMRLFNMKKIRAHSHHSLTKKFAVIRAIR